MSLKLIEVLEQAQAQTWWLPNSATVYEAEDFCFYKHNGRYEIVRFHPQAEELEQKFEHILGIVNGEPVRFLFFPHRHGQKVLNLILDAGFKKGHVYEARIIEVEGYDRKSPQGIEVKMVNTLEEMRQVYGVRQQIFGSDEPEPEAHLRLYLKEATGIPPKVRQFLAIDQQNGKAMSQAGLSIFQDLSFALLFAGGTITSARGQGAYTALVAARIAYARSIGIKHVGLFAREDTSAPIVDRQGFINYGEMQQWSLNC